MILAALLFSLATQDLTPTANDLPPTANVSGCVLREITECLSAFDSLEVASCRDKDGRYYNFHHFKPIYAFRITFSVTSFAFIPIIYVAAGPKEPPTLLAYDLNTGNTPTATAKYLIRDLTPDYYIEVKSSAASPTSTGLYNVDMYCEYCIEPTVLSSPKSVTVTSGGTARLSVIASGLDPLRYAWRQLGDELPTLSTEREYVTPPLAQTTSYYVDVTNDCGATRSTIATVTVLSPPHRRPSRHR